MQASKYEKTYVCAYKALVETKYVDKAAEFIKNVGCEVTCKEVGKYVFGEDYGTPKDDWMAKSHAAILGQILKHLVDGKFIKVEKVYGEPIEIEHEVYVHKDIHGRPSTIKVHDDEGNEYEIPNPKFVASWSKGSWCKEKKTIRPSHKVYTWVAE